MYYILIHADRESFAKCWEQLVKRLVEQECHNPHYEGTPDPPPGEYEVAEEEN